MLLTIACSKDKKEDIILQQTMVTVSFEHRIVEGNSMLRSTSNDFLDIIAEQTPKVVTITLENTDLQKTYKCQSNEQITIPVGNYTISAASQHSSSETIGNVGKYFHTKPSIGLSKSSIQITTSTNKIPLNLSYTCYAIFALIDECKSCHMYLHSEYGDFPKKGKYYIAYGKSDLNVQLIPYDNSSEFTSAIIRFVTSYDVTNTFAEFGKYYIIHPTRVDTATSSFDITMPEMQEGVI